MLSIVLTILFVVSIDLNIYLFIELSNTKNSLQVNECNSLKHEEENRNLKYEVKYLKEKSDLVMHRCISILYHYDD